jgi:glutamate formiminotransferase / formiminotetrahydrofolate cyclodeaminase
MSWVECVPNFSEGRRPEVIQSIVEAIRSVSIHLLDVSSDVDHNRTVVTFFGEPAAVSEAAFRGIARAAQLIDLDQHQGAHPRIGATDVVPFVPLRDISLAECATLAQVLGMRVANELDIPVFLYEAAAQRQERTNLAYVRHHPYEQLKMTIASDPDRLPDYGRPLLGKAGATAIGARGPLIAFNAFLNTADVTIAQQIAAKVRQSGGGLPYLKALGLYVNGQAQVSMNVVDFRQMPLQVILETVRQEARQLGVEITHTELVGLIPQAALFDAALAYLQLPPSTRHLILETRIGDTVGDYRQIPFE